MTHGFSEITIGGVLLAPLVGQAVIAFLFFIVLARPLLRAVPVDKIFANPSLIEVCLYVIVVAAVVMLY